MKTKLKIDKKKFQIHDEEINFLFQELGMSFRKFNGAIFWKFAKDLGHSSLDFKLCSCNKGNSNGNY